MKNLGVFELVVLMASTSFKDNEGAVNDKLGKKYIPTGREEGAILLITDADLVQVDFHLQYIKAGWNFCVKNKGRYDKWLSSLTCDISNIQYKEKVTITSSDARLVKILAGDEIVTNDPSVKEPWYRVDSHMDSVFFGKLGEYQFQVISDGVIPHSSTPSSLSVYKHTLINSLILKTLVN